jgi:hypothetical protein
MFIDSYPIGSILAATAGVLLTANLLIDVPMVCWQIILLASLFAGTVDTGNLIRRIILGPELDKNKKTLGKLVPCKTFDWATVF